MICFDYDGTLVNSLALEEEFYLPACRRHGIDIFPTMTELKAACAVNYYAYCEERGVDMAALEAAGKEYLAEIEEKGAQFPFYDGADTLVKELCQREKVYILSLNSSAKIAERCAAQGIRGLAGVYGYEESPSKVESFAALRQKHPGEPITFVTDSLGDLYEAQEAKVEHILAVTYGWHDREILAAPEIALLFDSVAELAAYFQGNME